MKIRASILTLASVLLIAATWVWAVNESMTARSDPAGQLFAKIIPIGMAIGCTIALCVVIIVVLINSKR